MVASWSSINHPTRTGEKTTDSSAANLLSIAGKPNLAVAPKVYHSDDATLDPEAVTPTATEIESRFKVGKSGYRYQVTNTGRGMERATLTVGPIYSEAIPGTDDVEDYAFKRRGFETEKFTISKGLMDASSIAQVRFTWRDTADVEQTHTYTFAELQALATTTVAASGNLVVGDGAWENGYLIKAELFFSAFAANVAPTKTPSWMCSVPLLRWRT